MEIRVWIQWRIRFVMFCYRYMGLTVRSEIALDLPLQDPDAGEAVDLSVRRGTFSCPEGAFKAGSPFFGCQGDRFYFRSRYPGDAHFCLQRSGEVLIDKDASALTISEQRRLLTQVSVVLHYLQGKWVLHAGAVLCDDRLLAFSGDSGAGKSTLSWQAGLRGWEFFSDDVCVMDWKGRQRPFAYPEVPWYKLENPPKDLIPEECTRLFDEYDGKTLVRAMRVEKRSLPLHTLYFLNWTTGEIEIRELSDGQKRKRFKQAAYRKRWVHRMGLSSLLHWGAVWMCQNVRMVELSRPRGEAFLEQTLARIEEDCTKTSAPHRE